VGAEGQDQDRDRRRREQQRRLQVQRRRLIAAGAFAALVLAAVLLIPHLGSSGDTEAAEPQAEQHTSRRSSAAA
jgi:hypothetical protein